jgi:hypothetical protein
VQYAKCNFNGEAKWVIRHCGLVCSIFCFVFVMLILGPGISQPYRLRMSVASQSLQSLDGISALNRPWLCSLYFIIQNRSSFWQCISMLLINHWQMNNEASMQLVEVMWISFACLCVWHITYKTWIHTIYSTGVVHDTSHKLSLLKTVHSETHHHVTGCTGQ